MARGLKYVGPVFVSVGSEAIMTGTPPVEWSCGGHYSFHGRQVTERMKMLEQAAFFFFSSMTSV